MRTELKYKLIACDFDGTLLRSDNTISEHTRAVIAEYVKRGGVFMPTTGRMHASIKRRMADIGLNGNSPISSYQGAMIRENVTDKVLSYKPIPYAAALKIASEAERLGLYVQAYDYDELIVSGLYDGEADRTGKDRPSGNLYGATAGRRRSFGRGYAERLGIDMTVIPGPISEYIRTKKIDCTKLLVVDGPDTMPDYLKHFSDAFPETICNTSETFMMEIITQGAGKDAACDAVCGLLGVGIDSCMALGDSMNDYEMIKHAGFGVAMANGRDAVKAAAKYVTDSNDDDGVAKAIEKFCL
ncbi:hydrolase [Clostridia bacterium]|nr:hydrolase [Clostridia bacterium]